MNYDKNNYILNMKSNDLISCIIWN